MSWLKRLLQRDPIGEDHDYIVLRSAPGLPALPAEYEGKWYDRLSLQYCSAEMALSFDTMVTCEATGEFEFRDDGAVAEVFRVVVGTT